MSGTEGRAGRIVEHTAATISKALDDMMADLPEDIAPQAILELVVVELAYRQPGFLRNHGRPQSRNCIRQPLPVPRRW